MKANNLLVSFIIESVIFVSILFWFLIGCTIIIPLLWNIECDYWNIKDFVEDMRLNKIK